MSRYNELKRDRRARLAGPPPTPNEVLDLAAAAMAARYPDADAAFVAGSLMRSQGSATSDVDMVVLFPVLPHAYRESFTFRGIPVEVFVHDPETLSWFFEQDRKDGRPALIGMVVEGVLVGPRQELALVFKKHATQFFEDGPPPLSKEAIDRLRYAITDKIDDLDAERTSAERVAIGASLYPLLVELALRGNNRWNGSGKWQARLLRLMDEPLAQQFETAFIHLYDGSDTKAVLRLAGELLSRHGGRLFAGYRSDAPAEWRLPVLREE